MTEPALPIRWRPRRARIAALITGAVIVLGGVAFAIVLPPPFQTADKVGVVFLALLAAAVLAVVSRSQVVADEAGVTVVNMILTRRLEWAEVLGVTFPPSEPWPRLELSGGDTVAALGIQRSDGAAADQAVATLRDLIRQRAETAEP